jgi:hypothetical protein
MVDFRSKGGSLRQLFALADLNRKYNGCLLYGTNEPDCLPLFSYLSIDSFPEEERRFRACCYEGLQRGTLRYHNRVRKNKQKT